MSGGSWTTIKPEYPGDDKRFTEYAGEHSSGAVLSRLNGINGAGRMGYWWELKLPDDTVITTALTTAPMPEPPKRWAERRIKQATDD